MATQTSDTLPAKEDVVFELIAAVRSGKYEAVKSILQGHGHNFLAKDIFNVTTREPVTETETLTPLIEACQNANDDFINDTGRQEEALEIVRLLLDYGADPDAKAWTRSHNQEVCRIPLHMAVKKSNVALTRVLLEGKAMVDQTDDDGRSALHICCTGLWINYLNNRYLEILNILISYKADVNLQDRNGETPLHTCIISATEHHDVIMALRDFLVSANKPNNTSESQSHSAIPFCIIDFVNSSLKREASSDKDVYEAYFAAPMCCHGSWSDNPFLEILNTLISCKADVNLQNRKGRTPLHLSTLFSWDVMTAALLQSDASASIQDHLGNNPLHHAVLKTIQQNSPKHLTIIAKLLEAGASVNQRNCQGQSVLHICCKSDDPCLEILNILMSYEADVNLRDKNGQTPLHLSITKDNHDLTAALLEKGAMASIQDNLGNSSLHCAVLNTIRNNGSKNLILTGKLLDTGASVNQTNCDGQSALHLCDTPEMATTLINNKADVNLQDKHGRTPLHLSCTKPNRDLTVALLVNGASVLVQDNLGNSPLHLASKENRWPLVRKFLDAGASVNLTNYDGQSALHLCDTSVTAATLIDYKADVDIQDNNGQTPLHLSCTKECSLSLATTLIDYKADENLQDKNGRTPLHLSCSKECGHSQVWILLENGAAVNQTDINGQSALHIFSEESNRSSHVSPALMQLIEWKADVNLQDKKGQTPMHLSCAKKTWDLMMTLLENGALATIQDNTGICPLHIALDKSNPHLVFMLDGISNRKNENTELICEAYELAALWMAESDSFEFMRMATLLRIEHNIPKKILEPMKCYGFCKEWETIEELETYRGNEKQLKLQAILTRERMHQGQYEKLTELVQGYLISAVLVASKSEAGELLKHHLNIWRRWTSVKPEGERNSSLGFVLLAWQKEFEENFESLDTMSLVELIQTTIDNLPESVGFDKCVLLTLDRLISLIMKLCRRNQPVEETSKTERMIAIELLQQLLDAEKEGEPLPLQHLITRQNFMFQNDGGMTKYIYDYELMKTLLEYGIQVNAVGCDGNTMLHIAVHSLMFCINKNTFADERHTYRFSEEVVNQWIRTVELLLEKGVYPNAQNKQCKTARDLLGVVTHDDREGITLMDVTRRISNILQKCEFQNSMTLKHMAAVVIKKSGYSYQNILPKALVKFVDLHKPRRHKISDKLLTK